MKASEIIAVILSFSILGCVKGRVETPASIPAAEQWNFEGPRFIGSNEFLRNFESLTVAGSEASSFKAHENARGRVQLKGSYQELQKSFGLEMWSSWIGFHATKTFEIAEAGRYEVFTQRVTAFWIDEQLYLGESFVDVRPVAEITLAAGTHKIRIQLQGLWPSDFRFDIRKKLESKPLLRDELVKAGGPRREFYKSKWDESEQHFAILEPSLYSASVSTTKKYAVILALHGAHVEDIEHLKKFKSKDWAFVVAPSNRGAQGLGWNDLASWDALDVLDKVLQKYPIDPDRIYLSGHSMGAQGALHLVLFSPDRFAAVSLAAPWIEPEVYLQAPFSLSNLILSPEGRNLRDRLNGNYRHAHRLDGLTTVPILLSTAEWDPVVSPLHSRWLEQELRSRNVDVTKVEHLGVHEHWCSNCGDFKEQDDFFIKRKRKFHDKFIIQTYDPSLHAGAYGVRIVGQEKVQNESKLWVSCNGQESCILRSLNIKTLEWNRSWPKEILWNDKPVFRKKVDDKEIIAMKKADLVVGSPRGSWVSFFSRPIIFLVADESSQRIAAVLKRQVERYSGQKAGILRAQEASQQKLQNANVFLVGLSESEFLKNQIWSRLPFDFNSKQISILDKTLNFENGYGVWMLRPSPWNSKRLLAIASGSDPARLGDLLRWLRPLSRLGQGLSDFIIFDDSVASREWGAVRAAGFFSPSWDLSSKEAFFFPEK